MTHNRWITAATAALLLAACQAPTAPRPDEVDGDDVVMLAIHGDDELSLEELIRLGQAVTGEVFTYSKADLAKARKPISLSGKTKVDRDEFMPFFQTILYINGFAMVEQCEDNVRTFEIIARTGSCHR